MPPRKKGNAYHHGDLKCALTDAAIELLGETGSSFTLRQAARRVGVTHGAAYRHFEDRDALLAEVARRGHITLRETLERAMRRADGTRAELEALLVGYVRFALAHPAQYDLMFGPRLNESGRFPELEEALERSVALLVAVLKRHLPGADSATVRDRGVAIWSLAHGYTSSVLRGRIKVRGPRAAERYLCRLAAALTAS